MIILSLYFHVYLVIKVVLVPYRCRNRECRVCVVLKEIDR